MYSLETQLFKKKKKNNFLIKQCNNITTVLIEQILPKQICNTIVIVLNSGQRIGAHKKLFKCGQL